MSATTENTDGSGSVLMEEISAPNVRIDLLRDDEIVELRAGLALMSEAVSGMGRSVSDAISANRARLDAIEAAGEWRTRVRVNVAKTATKGYTADTTVEVEWSGDGSDADQDAYARLTGWLKHADEAARDEVARREEADRAEGKAP